MKPANSAAMRGKTARACDGCLKRRAQWFCAADDAFLCRGCDSSVHSANQLASRHLRVRINNYDSSSIVSTTSTIADAQCLATPAWHQWFTRKARTPRAATNNNKFVKEDEKVLMMNPPLPRQLLAPQMEQEGTNHNNKIEEEEEEHELQCRVPVFDLRDINTDGNIITGFLDDPDTNDDFVEFAADVESLLDAEEGRDDHQNPVKIKDEEAEEEELGIANCYFSPDFEESLMGWDFDSDLPVIEEDDEEEEEEKKPVVEASHYSVINDTSGNLMMISNETQEEMRNISLRLNHEAVMASWATQGSPWTTGSRPALLNPNDYWLHCMGTNMHCEQYGGVKGQMGCSTDDSGREARVSRYREKRRTRLFSKKIRYEVRKLNAEKRPRLKGRFVKRTTTTSLSFAGTNFLTNK